MAADVAFGPRNLGLSEDEVDRRVEEALRTVGLDPEAVALRSPHRLSEGEKRRIALAGVLAMDPEMLVLDEPTAGLDPSGVRRIAEMLVQLHAQGKTIVLVSHNLDLVYALAPRVIVLAGGRIQFDGPREELLRHEEVLLRHGLALPRLVRVLLKSPPPVLPPQGRPFLSLREVEEALHARG